jgi:hypothetical protein
MDCCQSDDLHDAGNATPAALVLALALSLVATAMVGRSVMTLRLAKADLARRSAEYVLDGAQFQAAATVIRAGAGGPYRWAMPTDAGFAEALVEDERTKLTLAAAANLPDEAFQGFGVADVAKLKARLAAAAGAKGFTAVGDLDPAPLWRECAPSLMSSLGAAASPPTAAAAEPGNLADAPAWRVGEASRVRVTTAAGWRDDRIVRFTGDARHPAAVVRRQLSHSDGGQGRCDVVLAAIG